MLTTDKDLVAILRDRNTNGRYNQLIENALAGDYHTFRNKNGGLPKLTLSWALNAFPELRDIRRRVLNGEFDESIFAGDPVTVTIKAEHHTRSDSHWPEDPNAPPTKR